jgi:hypothetical protein
MSAQKSGFFIVLRDAALLCYRAGLPFLIYAFHSHYQGQIRYMDFKFQNSTIFMQLHHFDYVIFGAMYGLAALSAYGVVYSLYALINTPEHIIIKYLMFPVFLGSGIFYIYVAFQTSLSAILFTLLGFFQPMSFMATPVLLIMIYPFAMIAQIMQEH